MRVFLSKISTCIDNLSKADCSLQCRRPHPVCWGTRPNKQLRNSCCWPCLSWGICLPFGFRLGLGNSCVRLSLSFMNHIKGSTPVSRIARDNSLENTPQHTCEFRYPHRNTQQLRRMSKTEAHTCVWKCKLSQTSGSSQQDAEVNLKELILAKDRNIQDLGCHQMLPGRIQERGVLFWSNVLSGREDGSFLDN